MEYSESDFQIGDRIFHRQFGAGIIRGRRAEADMLIWEIEFEDGETRSCTHLAAQVTERERAPKSSLPAEAELKVAVREALEDILGLTPVPLGDRWIGGELILKPGKSGLKERSFPIEAFFHKIIMVRDRLRVLEQQINMHPKLDDEDRVHLQQYITRIYGSMTTFNMLFKDKEDNFVGEKTGKQEESETD